MALSLSALADTKSDVEALGASIAYEASKQASPSRPDTLNTFKETTGFSSATPTGSLNNSGSNVGAQAKMEYTGSLICSTGNRAYIGGYTLKVENCEKSGNTVSFANISLCEASKSGSDCLPADFTTKQINNNQSVSYSPNVYVGLSCSTGSTRCDVSLSDDGTIRHSAGNIEGAASQNASNQREDSSFSTVGKTYTDPNYRASMLTTGSTYSTCYKAIDGGLNSDGYVASCDGNQGTNFPADCQETVTCERYATSTTTWQDSCVEQLDVVTRHQNITTPYEICDDEIVPYEKKCSKILEYDIQNACTNPVQIVSHSSNMGFTPIGSNRAYLWISVCGGGRDQVGNFCLRQNHGGHNYRYSATFHVPNLETLTTASLKRFVGNDWISMRINGKLVYGEPYGKAEAAGFRIGKYDPDSSSFGNSGWCYTWRNYCKNGTCKTILDCRKPIAFSDVVQGSWTMNFDIKPFLKEGDNTVEFVAWVMKGGNMTGTIEFEWECIPSFSYSWNDKCAAQGLTP